MSFDLLGLHPSLLKAVQEKGYSDATAIQEKAIPAVLAGRDLIAGAQTGTGKTAAYTLPLLHYLIEQSLATPTVLVVVPTRELALQIRTQWVAYAKNTSIRVVALYGGAPMRPQIESLRRNPQVIVATPGRLMDHVERRTLALSGITKVVLDEADRMLDMGFLPDITALMERVSPTRQTLLFSATFDGSIRKLAQSFLTDPMDIQMSTEGAVSDAISHRAHPVDASQKLSLLTHIIDQTVSDQVLIFVRTKTMADQLAKQLKQHGQPSESIHGDKSQGQRLRILNGFRSGQTRLLVATDVAARGLDIPALPMVVNYDLPLMPEDYIHRIGRTGRAGSTGVAVSLVMVNEGHLIKRINQRLTAPIDIQPVDGYEPQDDQWMRRLMRAVAPPSFGYRQRGGGGAGGGWNKGGERDRGGRGPSSWKGKGERTGEKSGTGWDRRVDWRSRGNKTTSNRPGFAKRHQQSTATAKT